ncbi:ProQ/FINO family protein [Methylibium sp. Pch-M]|uniref:ProQ/FINO family protein n=1 Tax=Methylibium sp. Pch-M TaxID=2082386 RepID=UPI001F5D3095|nr:ProQ/FinO family protein [Methylibium sp. Pch-M]
MSDHPLPPTEGDAPAAAPTDEAAAVPAASTPSTPGTSPAATAAQLAPLFPAAFGAGVFLPLKLGIQADIQQRAPGVFTKKSLSAFLHRHTTSTAYLKALVGAAHRVDLDGQPAGDVADLHRAAATGELERRRALHDARRAAERQAQRAAHDEARQAHSAAEAAQRERAALLRAYETSTLTRANFCALKGLTETDLDAGLAQARAERDRRAAQPQPQRPPQQRPQANAAARGDRDPRGARPPGARRGPPGSRRPGR